MAKPSKQLTEPYVRWVEAEMAKKGWKAAELARQATLNQGQISRMLSRKVAPDMKTLEQIAKAFGKPLPELQPVPDRSSQNPAKRASSESHKQLSREEIATEIGERLEPLVLALAEKGNLVVAEWVLAIAAEANHRGVSDVKPLLDLAREFLWRAEHV